MKLKTERDYMIAVLCATIIPLAIVGVGAYVYLPDNPIAFFLTLILIAYAWSYVILHIEEEKDGD